METETRHQAICSCGYKSRLDIKEAHAWQIRDNHLWNAHGEYARSNSATVKTENGEK